MRLFQVVGRKAPTSNEETPQIYRMKLFAPNEVMAKSRFWYFMHQMRKMKKTTGEILDVNEVRLSFLFFFVALGASSSMWN
jgi:large subunit ribosomal protein L18Ae